MSGRPAVIAVAGRRIDPAGTPERFAVFPLRERARVRRDICRFLKSHAAIAVVASAACGADLIALQVARALDLRFRIVLPQEPETFYRNSVGDRPGHWKPIFDVLIREARRRRDLVVLPREGSPKSAYARATKQLIAEAISLAGKLEAEPISLAVWDRIPGTKTDETAEFIRLSEAANLATASIVTVPDSPRRDHDTSRRSKA